MESGAPPSLPGHVPLIVLGASTGGVEAIERVLVALPAWTPPIAIVQHIPAGFSRAFADRMNKLCQIRVREAGDGDLLEPGLALIAPGGFQMRIAKSCGRLRVVVEDGPAVCYQKPSVDVLFLSAAQAGTHGVVGVLLTGMGSDGAQGMLALREAGAHTIAQSQLGCAVFGMPKEAIRLGGAVEVVPLPSVAARLVQLVENGAAASSHTLAHR